MTARHTWFVAALLVTATGCSGTEPSRLGAEGAWARTTPTGATNGVVYLTVTTDVADTIVGASVDPGVADAAELHATTAADGQAGGHLHGGSGADVITMTDVADLGVEPGTPVVFEPGGNHVMLVDLARPLGRGEQFDLMLEFGSGRTLVVGVTVADNPPSE